jgi:hypothetical protein
MKGWQTHSRGLNRWCHHGGGFHRRCGAAAFRRCQPSSRYLDVSESGFSPELDKFIAAELQSLEQLEILLLLSGNPHRWWTAKSVYEVIKSSISSVQDRLTELVNRSVLKTETDSEVRYQFSPASDDLWRVVTELREAYKERPVKVVQALYNKPPDAVNEFAKAFKIRRDD